jgi:SAM-dependent methyltransferase
VRHLRWGFEYLCYQRHIKAVVESLGPSSVIEVGCGDGYLIGSLAPTIRRVGVDLSEQAIRFARAFRPDVEFMAVDAATIRDRFDAVLAIEVLEHIPDDAVPAFLTALGDRVTPGGWLVLSVPSDAVPVHAKHHRHYSETLLLAHVSAQLPEFRVERVDHVYAPPPWLELLMKVTCNRHVVFEITALNAVLWKYVWDQARLGKSGRARHLVGVFRKPA